MRVSARYAPKRSTRPTKQSKAVAAALAGILCLTWPGLVSAQPVILDSPLISVVDSRNGRVVEPQTVEILSVLVTERGGAPLADRSVVFAASDSAVAGVFPGSQPANGTFIRVQTTANGIAETTFLTGNAPGVFLVEAAVEGTNASVTFALTNIPGLPGPALAPEDARAQVAADVLAGAIEDENLRLHGPLLFPAGTQFFSHGPSPATDRSQPVVTDRLSWFFWVDDLPLAEFAHPTRFLLIDASDTSGQAGAAATINPDEWWPDVILPNGSDVFPLVPPFGGHEGIALAETAAAPLSPAPIFGDAPVDACAIVIYGPSLPQARQDTEEFRDYLLENDLVPAENIFLNIHNPEGTPFNRSASRQDIQRLIDAARKKDCKKMYFFLRTHGSAKSSSDGGGVSVRQETDADSGHLHYEDLVDMLSPFEGAEFCVLISSCYSGQFALWMQGRGFTGTIITSSDQDTVSYFRRATGGVLWTAFSAALENDDADTDDDDKVSFQEALDFALQQNPNDSLLNDPNPLGAPIDPDGTRQMRADAVLIYSKGSRRAIKVRRPKAAGSDTTFVAEVQSLQPSVAALDSETVRVELPPGTECRNVLVVGRSCDVTEYVINGTDAEDNKYIGSATVQVNDLRLSEETITIVPGEIRRITVTRYGKRLDDGSPTTIEVAGGDDNIAVPGILVPIPVPAGQATQDISIHGRNPGETRFIIEDTVSAGTKSLKVIVVAPPPPPPPPGRPAADAPSAAVPMWPLRSTTPWEIRVTTILRGGCATEHSTGRSPPAANSTSSATGCN